MPQMVSNEFVFVYVDGLEFFGLVILKNRSYRYPFVFIRSYLTYRIVYSLF